MKDNMDKTPYPNMDDLEVEYVEEMKELPFYGAFKFIIGTKILKALLEDIRAKKNHQERDKSLNEDLVYTF